MQTFIKDNFLLQSQFAEKLYYNFAKDLPIIDYHNHLPPNEIASNRVFENISQAWLAGDHYKWRAMRTAGINEHFITGKASDKEKFLKWAETVPYTVRNPLYHWTHLELLRYFNIKELLSPKNAEALYEEIALKLQDKEYHTLGLLQQQKVEYLCTTDDPTDTLEHHKNIQNQGINPKVFPTFRPDKAFAAEDPKAYKLYLQKLEEVANATIDSYDSLLNALAKRIDYFHDCGARLADHGMEQLYAIADNAYNCETLFSKVLNEKKLNPEELAFFKMKTLSFLSKAYHKKGWTQQFHLGAIRNNNKRLLQNLGPDTGFDSIGDFPQAKGLSNFLNTLDSTNQLTKTILYNLNPADNEVFAAMIGNFNDGSIKGKVQYGSGWWFLDQKDGMEKQINALSNIGLLSCFVGMLTDSRSFLSFPRHEYFRRILCNLMAKDVAHGELPADEEWLGKIVTDICYQNAKNYFEL